MAFAAIAVAQIPVIALARRVCRRIVFSGTPTERVVALSLDDAPSVLTPRVLELLSRHGARATFFAIGSQGARDPEVLRQIVAAGHELGNHTWDEESSFWLSREQIASSLARTHRVLAVAGSEVRVFRPGSGWVRPRTLAGADDLSLDYRCVLASVYPHDLRIPFRQFVVSYVVRLARPGSIIVLHEGKPEREPVLGVLEDVLVGLRRRGYRVTTVSELLVH